MTADKTLTILRSRRFLPLFLTQFAGAFNDNLMKNGLVILILYRLAADAGVDGPFMVTIAGGIFIAPFLLFSSLAGQLADKYEKSQLIRIIKIAEIGIMGLASAAFVAGSIWGLMASLFLMGTQSAFFGPLKYGILPNHLKPDELVSGNALIEAATFIAILVGTISGGLLIMAENGIALISIAMIVVAVTGYAASRLIPLAPAAAPDMRISYDLPRQTIAIIKDAADDRGIYLAILGISWFWFVGAVFLSQFPAYALETFNGDESVVTLFLALFSVGIGVGSLMVGRSLKGEVTVRPVPLAAVGMAISGLALAAASWSRSPAFQSIDALSFLASPMNWTVMAALFALAVCGAFFVVPLYAFVQHRAAPDRKSRTIAGINVVSSLFTVGAAAFAGALLATGLGTVEIFATTSLITLGVAYWVCRLLPHHVFQAVMRKVFDLAYRVEVVGLENLEKAGKRALICGHHVSFLDGPLLAAYLPGRPTFAVDTHQTRQWYMKPVLPFIEVFAIDPASPFATKGLIREVEKDKHCVIFPEGRITTTDALMKIYPGSGVIADKTGASIVPIRIDGAQFTPFSRLKGTLRRRLFPKITITLQEPHRIEIPDDLRGRARRRAATEGVYRIMSSMMFETSDADRTLWQALLDARALHGGDAVIVEDAERSPLSYDRLVLASLALGRKIAERTKPGDVVGVMLPSSAGAAITFFALQAYGRTPALLNFTAGYAGMSSACETAKIRQVLTSRTFIEKARLSEVTDRLGQDVELVHLEDIKATIGAFDKIRALVERALLGYRRIGGVANDPAAILFTSGSEGTPKGVVLSHRNLLSNCFQLAARVDFNPKDIVFNSLPVFHSFGLTGGLLLPMLNGVKTFLYPSPLHYRIVAELVYGTDATIMFGTDTFLAGYAKVADPYDFYRMRLVFAGAEKVREETRRTWMDKFGVRILEGYGVTECAPVIAVNTPMHNRAGTVGRLLPGIEQRIEPVPGVSTGGRLHVRGPNVMLGYLKADRPGVIQRPDESWHDTGDIVEIDDDGFIRIVGRAKRFAKIAGEMISLGAIEELAAGLWPDAIHVAVALSDPRKGQQVVLLTTRSDADRDELGRHAKALGLPEILIPREIIAVERIPLLGTGKTDYVEAQALAERLVASRNAA